MRGDGLSGDARESYSLEQLAHAPETVGAELESDDEIAAVTRKLAGVPLHFVRGLLVFEEILRR